jgi:hypothetical protein
LSPENIEEQPKDESFHLFDMDPRDLHDLFNDFDEAMEQTDPPEERPNIRLVRSEELA